MGLSASQCRYLALTARQSDLEYESQMINQARMNLSDQSSAIAKAYAAGLDKKELEKYTTLMGNYSGARTETYNKYISDELYNSAKDKAMKSYLEFVNKDLV